MVKKSLLFLFLSFCQFQIVTAQDSHFKDHLGFKETFFGNEEDHQVCYPKDHRNFFYSIFGFALLATTLGIAIFVIKSKSNKLLKEKNRIIEEKNYDLVSSITYAKRIQNAILPPKQLVNDFRDNLFVFYKPRDIVSGDFYWMHKQDNFLYMAVVDCTGHGVPGAFLSLIGQNSIDRAVKEDKLTNPTLILDKMNLYVKHILQQEQDSDLRDGMEVALCKLNLQTNVLEFAGANLGLVIVQNKNLVALKGSKCTVGSVQQHVVSAPKTETIQLNAGDSFYFYSDGFVDQVGGNLSKKFKSVQLKEALIKISVLPVSQQCVQLKNIFEGWKGDLEQVDDVCVLGYKI
ncbi:MAG: SpoIIE family protein phosphatase [Bacteroidota bacterium]